MGIEDYEIEVEYQAETIGKYDLSFNGKDFTLLNKLTACLCRRPWYSTRKQEVKLSEISNQNVNSRWRLLLI
jgi:DNA-directed RNA polymerase subunit L